MQSSIMLAKRIYPRHSKRTPVSAIITSPVASVNERFQFQHGGYFQDRLILQTISKIASNYWEKQAASSHQYNDAFHYYSYLKETSCFDNTEFSPLKHVVDHPVESPPLIW